MPNQLQYENYARSLGFKVQKDVVQYLYPITNYIYLYHVDKLIKLPNYPENLQDSSSANFAQNTPLGRSAPIWSYQNSGPRTVGFQFELHREMLDQVNGEPVGESMDTVDTLVREIQAAVLPTYASSSKMVDPPLVACRVGNEVYIKGIISGSVSVGYSGPILYNDKYAICTLGFTVTEVDPYDAYTVMNIGSYRFSNDIPMNTSLDQNVYSAANGYSGTGGKRLNMTR